MSNKNKEHKVAGPNFQIQLPLHISLSLTESEIGQLEWNMPEEYDEEVKNGKHKSDFYRDITLEEAGYSSFKQMEKGWEKKYPKEVKRMKEIAKSLLKKELDAVYFSEFLLDCFIKRGYIDNG
ncbi:MAG: hypothetical protein ACOCRO_10385 [Halanaerobiales bacterium]